LHYSYKILELNCILAGRKSMVEGNADRCWHVNKQEDGREPVVLNRESTRYSMAEQMKSQHADRHRQACNVFINGVVFMTKRRFNEARQCIDQAYRAVVQLFGEDHADALHMQFYGQVNLLAEGKNTEITRKKEFLGAQGIMQAWEALKTLYLAEQSLEMHGSNQQATKMYLQSQMLLERAISLMEQGLGKEHPELEGPLVDYCSILYTFNEEEKAKAVDKRASELPKPLSPFMIGGGYIILRMDPFGNTYHQTPK
jgi:hypothetical protein